MSLHDDIFEEIAFRRMGRGVNQKSKAAAAVCAEQLIFEDEVNKNMLNFDSLRKVDKSAIITHTANGYRIVSKQGFLSLNIQELMMQDNPGIDLSFSPDMLDFEPDQEMIRKSTVPLWVIKQMNPGHVLIQRTFR